MKLGHVMTVTGRVVFTSSRTLDIEVFVDCEDILAGISFWNVFVHHLFSDGSYFFRVSNENRNDSFSMYAKFLIN